MGWDPGWEGRFVLEGRLWGTWLSSPRLEGGRCRRRRGPCSQASGPRLDQRRAEAASLPSRVCRGGRRAAQRADVAFVPRLGVSPRPRSGFLATVGVTQDVRVPPATSPHPSENSQHTGWAQELPAQPGSPSAGTAAAGSATAGSAATPHAVSGKESSGIEAPGPGPLPLPLGKRLVLLCPQFEGHQPRGPPVVWPFVPLARLALEQCPVPHGRLT